MHARNSCWTTVGDGGDGLTRSEGRNAYLLQVYMYRSVGTTKNATTTWWHHSSVFVCSTAPPKLCAMPPNREAIHLYVANTPGTYSEISFARI